MKITTLLSAAAVTALMAISTQAFAECYGDPGYQVCTETTVDPDGGTHITSSDSMGNSYSVDSGVTHDPDGGTTVESHCPSSEHLALVS